MNGGEVLIRWEQSHDESGVRAVNEAAFGQSDEADLVDRLRLEGAVLASFVAEQERDIIGHILFSRTLIDAVNEPVLAVALAPLAVLPLNFRECDDPLSIQPGPATPFELWRRTGEDATESGRR